VEYALYVCVLAKAGVYGALLYNMIDWEIMFCIGLKVLEYNRALVSVRYGSRKAWVMSHV
jgi:hypothetical protein